MQRDIGYFSDILDSTKLAVEYLDKISYNEFKQNTAIQDAVIRRIEIIGEAVKNLSNEIKNKYPEIPWRKITGMKDILIHKYFGIDLELTWEVVIRDLDELKNNIIRIKEELSD